jgi:hypothetical protein
MPVTIDIVAAVKEALQDSEVQEQIRTIVRNALPSPPEPVEALVNAEAAAKLLGITPAALRMAVHRGTIPTKRSDAAFDFAHRCSIVGEHKT